VRREVLYNIFIEFGVPMKLVRLIKMSLNEMYSKVCVCKHFSDSFLIQNVIHHPSFKIKSIFRKIIGSHQRGF
jgi:hypothetical protein